MTGVQTCALPICAPEADFPAQGRFAALKAEGQLISAEATARRLLAWLHHPDFGSEAVDDIRQRREVWPD